RGGDADQLPRSEALELQGLSGVLRIAALGLLIVALWAGAAGSASAKTPTVSLPQAPATKTVTVTRATKTVTVAASNTPVLVTDATTPPKGYRLTAVAVLAIARRDPRVTAELHRHPRAIPYEYTKGPGQWQ